MSVPSAVPRVHLLLGPSTGQAVAARGSSAMPVELATSTHPRLVVIARPGPPMPMTMATAVHGKR